MNRAFASSTAAYYAANVALVLAYAVARAAFPGAGVQRPSSYFSSVGLTSEAEFAAPAVILALQRWQRCVFGEWGGHACARVRKPG